MSKLVCYAACSLIAIVGMTQGASAQQRGIERWEDLGCVEVGRRTDRDIIKVGRRDGRFNAIRLSVSGNDIELEDLKVVYGNGQSDDIRVRNRIREGGQTRAIDLQGRDRFIDRIEIISKRDFKGPGRGRARICVTGLHDARFDKRGGGQRHGGNWERLGCQKVGFLIDRDVIRVGRQEGRFDAIRVEVLDNDVHMMDLKVVYANGEPDDIRVRSKIRAGGQSGPLDLKGRNRAIRHIEMTYRSRPSFRGSAKVCVSGHS